MTDSETTGDLTVVDVHESSRFELRLHGERVGMADYSVVDGVMTVRHVETAVEHRGHGFAARLMRGLLESARSNGQTIRPLCPYAAAYMRRNPATHDLLAERVA